MARPLAIVPNCKYIPLALSLIILLYSFINGNVVIDIQLHDTYLVVNTNSILYTFLAILLVNTLVLHYIQYDFLERILIVYAVTLVVSTGFVIYLLSMPYFSIDNDSIAFFAILLFLISQTLFILYLVMGYLGRSID